MAQRAYEWDPRPPTSRERIICGIWLVAFVLAAANHYAGWRLFWGYDNWVFGALLLASFFVIGRLPGVRRVEGVQQPLTYWPTVGLVVVGAVILSLVSSRH